MNDTNSATLSGGRAREPLSRERILAAAIDFVDRNCLDELSMRKLGAQLGVEAMSLYRYFPSKDQLLEGVVDALTEQLRLPPADEDWRAAIREFARSFRTLGQAHPRALPLLMRGSPRSASLRKRSDAIESVLARAGFDDASRLRAQCAVMGYVLGSTMWLADRSVDAAGRGESVTAELLAAEAEAHFEFGLDVLLAGLDAELGRTERG